MAYPVGSEVLLLYTRMALKSLYLIAASLPQYQPQSCRLLGIVNLEILKCPSHVDHTRVHVEAIQ